MNEELIEAIETLAGAIAGVGSELELISDKLTIIAHSLKNLKEEKNG